MRQEGPRLRFWIFALIVVGVTSVVVLSVTGAWANAQAGTTSGTSGTGGTGGTTPPVVETVESTPTETILTPTPAQSPPVAPTSTPDTRLDAILASVLLAEMSREELHDRITVLEGFVSSVANDIDSQRTQSNIIRSRADTILAEVRRVEFDWPAWEESGWVEWFDNQDAESQQMFELIAAAQGNLDNAGASLNLQGDALDALIEWLIEQRNLSPTPQATVAPTAPATGPSIGVCNGCQVGQ